jgi:hypothetical protein
LFCFFFDGGMWMMVLLLQCWVAFVVMMKKSMTIFDHHGGHEWWMSMALIFSKIRDPCGGCTPRYWPYKSSSSFGSLPVDFHLSLQADSDTQDFGVVVTPVPQNLT